MVTIAGTASALDSSLAGGVAAQPANRNKKPIIKEIRRMTLGFA
jgi:hypothetical protein